MQHANAKRQRGARAQGASSVGNVRARHAASSKVWAAVGMSRRVAHVKEVENKVVERREGPMANDDDVLLARPRGEDLPPVDGVASERVGEPHELPGHLSGTRFARSPVRLLSSSR